MKFLLIIQVCSALHMSCMNEMIVNEYPTHFDCARQGTVETVMLLDSMGEELVNKNKLYVGFSCKIVGDV